MSDVFSRGPWDSQTTLALVVFAQTSLRRAADLFEQLLSVLRPDIFAGVSAVLRNTFWNRDLAPFTVIFESL